MKKYINLLPPSQKQRITLDKVNSQLFGFGVWTTASLLILVLLLFLGQIFLSVELEAKAQEISLQLDKLAKLQETGVRREVEVYNQRLTNFLKLEESYEDWSKLTRELAGLLPGDMTIDSLNVSRADKKIILSGHARSRASVLRLRENLLTSPNFVNVNFPLSNLESSANLVWKYRFYYKL